MTGPLPESAGKALLQFPIDLNSTIDLSETEISRSVKLYSGLTVIIGPNGSGKTLLLRSLKNALSRTMSKKVRFISAGRMGMLEQYRSIFNRHYSMPRYDEAAFGGTGDLQSRHTLETLEGDFQALAARPDILLKVRERLRKLFNRDISIAWDQGSLKINFLKTKTGTKVYSSAREASGLVHLVGLLAAIYDDDVGALLLDEPEVSLHPQLQAFLLREITDAAGLPSEGYKKVIVISTHSTEFLRIEQPSDLPNLIFCTDPAENVVQISSDAGELSNQKIAELISRMGQEHKLAFFAHSPLLVEGPSDTIVCAGLASKLDIHIEAGGSQLLPVIGKGQFPVVVKLMRMMGKKPIVLADADAFTDGNELANTFLKSCTANAEAAKAGHENAMHFFRNVHSDFCAMVDGSWSHIRNHAEQSVYWASDDDELKRKRRSAFTALFAKNADKIGGNWPFLKNRIEALLNLFEHQGCYFLRLGTIESYYSKLVDMTSIGKPSAAAEEVLAIRAEAIEKVEVRYTDVLRCLRMAAASQDISEADVIQDLILGIATPALRRLRNNEIDIDFNIQAKASGDPLAELFDITTHNGKLIIKLKSKILDKRGFPITIGAKDDIVTRVTDALGTAKK